MATTALSIASSAAPPRSPSPGLGAVPLSSAIAELLRFVLASRAAASDDPAFRLSPSYCARLLDDRDLFEKLAASLVQCIEEGRMPRSPVAEGVVAEDEGSEEREREWEAMLLEKGAELKQMYDAVDFELHMQEPYFTQLKAAQSKTVEGRLATDRFNWITLGSLLLFNKCLLLNVEALRKYISFSEMLQTEIIANVLPGISSVEEGVKVYRKFYTEEKEKEFGVLAISVLKPPGQPYITMAHILDSLGYDGLGRVLGMGKTTGTISDGLPPPRSTLMSSAMNLHHPHEH